MVSFWSEMVRDRTKRREKALGMTGGFEPTHRSLSLPGWLVGVLRSIVQSLVLAMLHARQELFLGRSIAGQFIGNDHSWHVLQPLCMVRKMLVFS